MILVHYCQNRNLVIHKYHFNLLIRLFTEEKVDSKKEAHLFTEQHNCNWAWAVRHQVEKIQVVVWVKIE